MIDTSIYNRVGTGATFGNLATGFKEGAGIRQHLDEREKKRTLGDLFKTNTSDSGELNRQGFSSGMAQAGYGADLPEYQKQWAAQDKAKADARTADLDFQKKRQDYINGGIQSLAADPNLTRDKAMSFIGNLVSQGFMTHDEAAAEARVLQEDPRVLHQQVLQRGIWGLDAKQRLDALTPQISAQNLGGHTQMVDTNALTNPGVVGQTFQRSMTPGEAESARHNRVSEGQAAQRLSMERDAPRGQVFTAADGSAMLIDPRTGTARPITGQDGAQVVGRVPGKTGNGQLPAAALKMQQEDLDAIGTASAINSDLGRVMQQIESGALNLGFKDNWLNRGRNFAGMSNEQSRNLASFEATLERLRNESLRLNKGVQTDGDAQRAWNELLANINDPGVVMQRLAEIQQINERAVQLRQLSIDQMRANYGLEPLDSTAFQNVGARTGGASGSWASPDSGAAAAQPQASWQDAGYASQAQAVSDALQAIHAGADKQAVIQRLEASGITNHEIK